MKGTFESEAIWCSKLLVTHPRPEGKQSWCDMERFLSACMGSASENLRVRDISTLLQHCSYWHPLAWCIFQLGGPRHLCNCNQTGWLLVASWMLYRFHAYPIFYYQCSNNIFIKSFSSGDVHHEFSWLYKIFYLLSRKNFFLSFKDL